MRQNSRRKLELRAPDRRLQGSAQAVGSLSENFPVRNQPNHPQVQRAQAEHKRIVHREKIGLARSERGSRRCCEEGTAGQPERVGRPASGQVRARVPEVQGAAAKAHGAGSGRAAVEVVEGWEGEED